jgi:RimJ/RimL family protein N-acetyltransferase
VIETDRLVIRPWQEADRAPFAAMGQDAAVMAHLGPLMDRAASDAVVDRLMAMQQLIGHCFWALELRASGDFIGLCGLKPMPMGIPGLTGTPEIGWRLARDWWGLGLASEAARACLAWGWSQGMTRIAAITTHGNVRSQAVMRRIGMQERPDLAFDHPALAPGDPLRPHVAFETARS